MCDSNRLIDRIYCKAYNLCLIFGCFKFRNGNLAKQVIYFLRIKNVEMLNDIIICNSIVYPSRYS